MFQQFVILPFSSVHHMYILNTSFYIVYSVYCIFDAEYVPNIYTANNPMALRICCVKRTGQTFILCVVYPFSFGILHFEITQVIQIASTKMHIIKAFLDNAIYVPSNLTQVLIK